MQNQQSWTELTLNGVQRGIERNRTLEKTYSRIILSYFFFRKLPKSQNMQSLGMNLDRVVVTILLIKHE